MKGDDRRQQSAYASVCCFLNNVSFYLSLVMQPLLSLRSAYRDALSSELKSFEPPLPPMTFSLMSLRLIDVPERRTVNLLDPRSKVN
ncbi:hypothetical protein KC329_g30 [Hortaea werneckii]|nr:hypothetical protein KC329_g30 [Hortaea werneckii]